MIKTVKEAKESGYTVASGKWKHCGIFNSKYFDPECKLPNTSIILEERISDVINPKTKDKNYIVEYRARYDVYSLSNGTKHKTKTIDRGCVYWDAIRNDYPELNW